MTGGQDVMAWLCLEGAGELPGTRPDRVPPPEAEALVTALFHLAPPAAPPAGLFAAIEAEIDAPVAPPILRADAGSWRLWLDKIWRKDLTPEAGRGPSVYLLRCEPGAVLPAHGHDRDEIALVLEGAFVGDDGIVRAGDCQFAAADSDHAEHHSPEGCLVLVCG